MVPSIRQILSNSELGNMTYYDQIDNLLSKYGIRFSDLEISNYNYVNHILKIDSDYKILISQEINGFFQRTFGVKLSLNGTAKSSAFLYVLNCSQY
mgnify:CR=1 FL=1